MSSGVWAPQAFAFTAGPERRSRGGYGSESHSPPLGAGGERVYFMEFACALFWGTYLSEIDMCGYVDNVCRVQLVLLYMMHHDLK